MSNLIFHIKELGLRSIYPLLFIILSFILFSNYFLELLILLLSHSHISFFLLSSPFDAFSSYLKICTYLAIILNGVPILIIQIYLFFRSALFFSSNYTLLISDIIIIGGSYFFPLMSLKISLIFLPYTINLLLSPLFNIDLYTLLIWIPKVSSILNLFISLSLISLFYLIFPILIMSIQLLWGNPNYKAIFKNVMINRHYLFFFILLILSILSPPDLITLLIISVPLIILFEFSFFLSLILFSYSFT